MSLVIQVTHNDTVTELRPSESIPLRLDISRVENGEIGSVFGTFSQEFSVIRDESTKAFFEYGDEFGSSEEIPGFFTELDAVVLSSNDIVAYGLFSLESINIEDGIYVCRFQGNDTELTAKLEGKKVNEAEGWTDYIHPYTYLSAMRSWSLPTSTPNLPESSNDNCVTYHIPDLELPSGNYAKVVYTDCSGVSRSILLDSTSNHININGLASIRPIVLVNVDSDGFGGYPSYTVNITFGQSNVQNNTYVNPYNNQTDVLSNGAIFYPLIDQGNDGAIQDENFGFLTTEGKTSDKGSWTDTTTPMKIHQLTPAIRLRDVFDVMFDEAGKEYESHFIKTSMNDCYILAKNYDGLGVTADRTVINGFVTNKQSTGFTHRFTGVASPWSTDRDIITVGDDAGSYKLVVGDNDNFEDGVFTAPIDGTYEFEFSFDWSVTSHDYTRWRRVIARTQIRTDSSNYTAAQIDAGAWQKEFNRHTKKGDNGSETITKTYTLTAGDKVWIDIRGVRGEGARYLNLFFNNYQFRTLREPQNWEASNVNPGKQFDNDLEWTDLLTAIVQKFNLVIYPDQDNKDLYHVEPYYNWINQGKLVDWSTKVDLSKALNKTPLASEQEKTLIFSNAEDDDVLSKQSLEIFPKEILGSTGNVVTADSSKLSGKKEIGDFFAPLGVANFQPLLVPTKIENYNEEVLHLWEKDGTDKVAFGWAPRIGFRSTSKVPPESSYFGSTEDSNDYQEISTYQTLVPFNNRLSMSTQFELDSEFPTHYNSGSRGAYEVFWKDYIDNLYREDNYKIECNVYLEPDELVDLELNNHFLIGGEKFTINRISGFNLAEPDVVKVELIRFYDNYTNIDFEGVKEPDEESEDSPTADPIVSLVADDYTPTTGDTVTFTATVENFDDELDESYDWFAVDPDGDEVTLTGTGALTRTLTHSTAEKVEVTLTVHNDEQTATGSVSTTFSSDGTEGTPPTVSLAVDDSSPDNGETVTVTATYTNFSGTADWEHSPTSGTTEAVTSNTVHTFTRSTDGTVVVKVSVENDDGSDTDTVVITWTSVETNDPPTVQTVNSTSVTENSAQLNGFFHSDGGATVSDQGFYLYKGDTTNKATIKTGTKLEVAASDRGDVGAFSLDATSLDSDSTYSFFAYATNSEGTDEDVVIQFTTDAPGVQALYWTPSNLSFGPSSSTKEATLTLQNISEGYVVEPTFYLVTPSNIQKWATIAQDGNTLDYNVTVDDLQNTNAYSFRVGYFRAVHNESGSVAYLYITQTQTFGNNTISVENESGFSSYGKPAGIDGLVVTTNPWWVRWTASITYEDGSGWLSLSPTQAFGSTTATLSVEENDSGAIRQATVTFTACDTDFVPLEDAGGNPITADYVVTQTLFEDAQLEVYFLDNDSQRLTNNLTTNPLSSLNIQPNGSPVSSTHSRNIEVDGFPSDVSWTATVSGLFGTPFDGSWLTLNNTSGTGDTTVQWTASNNTGGSRGARVVFTATTGTDTAVKQVYIVQQGSGGQYIPGGSGETTPSWGSIATNSITSSSAQPQATLEDGGATVTDANLYYGTQSTKATLRTSGTKVDGITVSEGVKSQSIAGLSSSTTYYYFWEATNSKGTGESGLQNFTTSAMSYSQTFSGTNSISGPSAGYTLTNLTQSAQSGTSSQTYTFSDISASLNTGYQWATSPTTSGDSLTGNFGGSDQVTNRTITGTVELIPAATYTADYSITNSISGPAAGYDVPSAPADQTGSTGDSYSFTDPSVPTAKTGYTFTTAPSWSGDSLTGTFASSDVTVNRTLSGTIAAVAATYTASYSITNNISGPSAGYTVPTAPSDQTGSSGDSYSFTDPSVPTAKAGYSFTTAPSWSGDSLSGTFASSDVTVSRSLSGTIVQNAVSMASVATVSAAGATGITSVATTTGSATLSASSTSTWISNISFSGNTMTFDVAANTGAARNGSISVSYGGATTNLTVSQASGLTCSIDSVTVTGNAVLDQGDTQTYTANVTTTGTCTLSYAWTTGNANASVNGSSTGNTVNIDGDSPGAVQVRVTVSGNNGATDVMAFLKVDVVMP